MTRPPLDQVRTGTEITRWYWLRSELAQQLRALGLSTAGGKAQLAERLCAHLDGDETPAPAPQRLPAVRLTEPLTADTMLPVGQRCSQQLRSYLSDAIGPGFRFDQHMRDVIGAGGVTLEEVIEHWRRTRTQPQTNIGPQFELNQFLRDWHRSRPGRSHAEALTAWREHRATPRNPPGTPPEF